MSEYIERDAFLAKQRHLYCDNCARRKNSKGKLVYDIGDAPCRACDICDVLDAVEDAPAADVRPVEWIPVTERLPEDDGWYLVYAPDYRGGSSSGLKCVDGKMFCKFAKGKWSIEHGYYNRPGCVTHWMPLPEPPKEET